MGAKMNLKRGNFNVSNKLLLFSKSTLKTLSSVKFSQKYKAVEILRVHLDNILSANHTQFHKFCLRSLITMVFKKSAVYAIVKAVK